MMFRVLEKQKENKTKTSKILNIIMIGLAIILLLFSIAAIIHRFHQLEKDIFFKGSGSLFGLSILVKIIHHNFFQQKKGVFAGELKFDENEIEVLNKIYPLDSISKIRIKGNDLKGEFTGLKTEGINNELFIDLINGNKINCFFEQTTENCIKNISLLKSYVDEGKLAESNYESIMANTNYY